MIWCAGRWGLRNMRMVLPVFVLCWVSSAEVQGYVIPPEQLLEFMAENVAGFQTLGLTWEHRSASEEEGEEPVVMDVWFRPPEEVRVAPRGIYTEGVPEEPELAFLSLFSGNQHLIQRFLTWKGVDLGASSYTRLDRVVAYRIGRKSSGTRVLLLEKSRFIPLLLRYEPDHAGAEETTEIRFQEYRRLEDGWFPRRILYRTASGVTGTYRVRDLRRNEPHPSGFSSMERSKEGERASEPVSEEEKRLESVIRAFEEKYGD